ncbi:MAG: PAS domain-containing protein, partial [Deltaproteobacteria bacterium]|nr:PAS domain-containing protein [Deltaproteobacteria bacterium]
MKDWKKGSRKEAARCRQAEEALKGGQENLRTILDSVPAGIVTIDAESHTIVDVNLAALQIIGTLREQIVGKVCHNFICPEDECKCPITDLGQTMDNSERVLIRPDGKTVPILKTVASVIIDGRMYLIESFLD